MPRIDEAATIADQILKLGEQVRGLKVAKAPKEDVLKAVDELKAAKAKFEAVTGEEYLAPGQKPAKKKPEKTKAAPTKPPLAPKPAKKAPSPMKDKSAKAAAAPAAAADPDLANLDAALLFQPFLDG